jgi:hypothetical protein
VVPSAHRIHQKLQRRFYCPSLRPCACIHRLNEDTAQSTIPFDIVRGIPAGSATSVADWVRHLTTRYCAGAPRPVSITDGLPRLWERYTDSSSGRSYFYDRRRNVTTWDIPAASELATGSGSLVFVATPWANGGVATVRDLLLQTLLVHDLGANGVVSGIFQQDVAAGADLRARDSPHA